VDALAPVMHDLPGVIVTIDGRDGVGKTTLGRYRAWHFNVSLLETDLFMVPNQGEPVYFHGQIDRIIERRLSIPRPIIVEGITMGDVMQRIHRSADFAIYVTNREQTSGPRLASCLSQYEARHAPQAKANVVLEITHNEAGF
jgi:hypothetical protein